MKLSTLLPCKDALIKLFNYTYLPARQIFYLSTMQRPVMETLESYANARNSLLAKYGTSEDGQNYNITGDNIAAYQTELAELEEQETGISFPDDKITLCVESIEKAEKDLPPDKRLGFSANDWAVIQGIIKVTEAEV